MEEGDLLSEMLVVGGDNLIGPQLLSCNGVFVVFHSGVWGYVGLGVTEKME